MKVTLPPSKKIKYADYSEHREYEEASFVFPGRLFLLLFIVLLFLFAPSFVVADQAMDRDARPHTAPQRSALYPTDLVERLQAIAQDETAVVESETADLQTLRLYSRTIIERIERIVGYFERPTDNAADAALADLEQLTLRWDTVRNRWPHKITQSEPFVPSAML